MQQKPALGGCIKMPGGGTIQIAPMAKASAVSPAAAPSAKPGPGASSGAAAAAKPVQVQMPSIQKTVQGSLDRIAQSPAVETFEQIFRSAPNDAWFDPTRNPTNPTQFEIGNFVVPDGKALVILDFSFEAYKFSGAGAFSTEPIAEKSLNRILGYSLSINDKVPGVVKFNLEPLPSNFERQRFKPSATQLVSPIQRTEQDFQRTAAGSYGLASGYGTGIMPQRLGRFGTKNAPFSAVAVEKQNVSLACVIYRPVPIPVAFVEASISGYLGSVVLIRKLLADLSAGQ